MPTGRQVRANLPPLVCNNNAGGRGDGSAVLDELLIALVRLRTLDQMAHQ